MGFGGGQKQTEQDCQEWFQDVGILPYFSPAGRLTPMVEKVATLTLGISRGGDIPVRHDFAEIWYNMRHREECDDEEVQHDRSVLS